MELKLNVLLGAGFSFHAGIPMVKEISERFLRDNRNKLLRQSSLEWQWQDNKSKADLINGKQSGYYIGGGYILNELVSNYKNNENKFENYEIFFQYIMDENEKSKLWIKKIFSDAEKKFKKDYPKLDDYYSKIFSESRIEVVTNLVNELISDLLLEPTNPDEQLKEIYEIFFNYIDSYNIINIFSLNHDLLVEKFLEHLGIDYANGFSTAGSRIKHADKKQKQFNGDFKNKKYRVYKLHGSKDVTGFNVMHQEKNVYTWTGEVLYFIPENYYAKHNSIRIDESTGNIVQDFQPNISPFFVTGGNKLGVINKNVMLTTLFDIFKNEIDGSDLLIIGYSFGDTHINNILDKKLREFKPNVINVNPDSYFIIDNYENLVQKKDICEL